MKTRMARRAGRSQAAAGAAGPVQSKGSGSDGFQIVSLLEAVPDAVLIATADGCITFVNTQAEELFGYRREELLGRPVEMLIPERYRQGHPAHRRDYTRAPRTRPMGAGNVPLYGLRKDGRELPVEISLSPFDMGHGMETITTIRDVSERVRVEAERASLAQTREALRLRDEFLAVASHELKTPLGALSLQVDGLLRIAQRDPGAEKFASRVQAISGAAGRLSKLIDQLLDLSRINAGRLVLERSETDLAEIVRQVARQFQDELVRAQCPFTLHAYAPVRGALDPLRVEQIVTNLLSNAIKYGRGKPIEVTVSRASDGAARLVVRDQGIGIAPEHQARIFERFERIIADRSYGGLGLGLWITRQIIEAHGGTIAVESRPSDGSTFTVDFPSDGDRASPAKTPLPASAGGVLLVEDDVMIQDAFRGALEDAGCPVITAPNGMEALRALRAGLRPCLILLDLMMPVMDGAVFRAEQQRDPSIADLPVCVISAATNVRQQAASMGVALHLKKPVPLDTLLRIVGDHCSCEPVSGQVFTH